MQSRSGPAGSEGTSVRRSPRLSPQAGSSSSSSSEGGNHERRKASSLQEVKRRGRMERSSEEQQEDLNSQLRTLDLSNRSTASGTGLVFSEIFTHHQNLWEPSHVESPYRVTSIMEELQKQELLGLCVRVQPREASEEELLLAHSKDYIDMMKLTQTMTQTELQTLSNTFDSVYIHPQSFQVCVTAVGSVLQLVDRVVTSELRNGFAVIRPPGHHAQNNEPNGFCLFNSVAVAAQYARSRHAISRVLIVDWDVHHGQGIQYLFQDNPSVLYFSLHRYEGGSFWPHLSESDSSFVGHGRAAGRTINLPWNQTGMSDVDYINAFQQVLLPVACEFQPQLVLVSAGFDATVGDVKGKMCVTPPCFHILTHMLMRLAEGRLVLALEGGYNLQATAEGVAACVRALLGGACPPLTLPTAPSDSALQSISQTISAQCPYWASLQVLGDPSADGDVIRASSGEKSTITASPTPSVSMTTGLVYDERMMEHMNLWDRHHPEQPQRIFKIFSKHQQLGLVHRCQQIPARLATEEELAMCHSMQYIGQMKATAMMKPRDLYRLGHEFTSVFLNKQSFQCAQLAAGSCFNAVDCILDGQVSNAVAIVRPPGHHAERDAACGFCLFNSTALAARYAQKVSPDTLLRVLILDWDVHHGNGTQHLFEDDDSVLYISLHRYDNATFFPHSEDAASNRVGVAKGAGYNVNVAWCGGRMGDSDYLAAFHHVVMPIATEFNPGLVLVSAGFDAARGDPLGGYHVSPEGYAHLTHMLMSLAGGRVLIILEGGYNLTSISDSMAMCTSMLLGDPPPSLIMPLPPPHHNAVATITEVIQHHAPYWRSLRIHIPKSVRSSLPSPKHRGKRSSKGKGRVTDEPLLPPAGAEVSTDRLNAVQNSSQSDGHSSQQSAELLITVDRQLQVENSLDQLTQGLATLDISQSSTNQAPPAVSSLVGGAKNCLSSDKNEKLIKAKSEDSQATESMLPQSSDEEEAEPEADGACGWSKSQVSLEVKSGDEVDGSILYVVDPLPWCPHLDAVRPLPSSGINISLPCKDCGSEAENWICLTCYQVFCGRYVNEHMVSHGVVSEHPVVLSFSDLSVWCYLCESYVHHQILFEAKNSAHMAKFGEEVPPWS